MRQGLGAEAVRRCLRQTERVSRGREARTGRGSHLGGQRRKKKAPSASRLALPQVRYFGHPDDQWSEAEWDGVDVAHELQFHKGDLPKQRKSRSSLQSDQIIFFAVNVWIVRVDLFRFCAQCTLDLAQMRQLKLQVEEFCWVQAAGETMPWPAQVLRIDFSSLADPKPYWAEH
ncbi:Uncharacterized protein SCF082_LOCUS37791 [Durusdinium trenchii]|uniref:Uncharacterized protein n=1 Tax=Durusdinium trenchii TaxID=1381693 RepID=A0ABP0PT20_9DINO